MMNEGLFREQWFKIFKRKIIDLNLNYQSINDEELDVMPIIYCCLINRMILPNPRRICLSKEFNEEIKGWENIKKIISTGEDINPYMSKRIKDWREHDLLLYSAGISHFHLSKNKSGGVKDELVFGIFTKNDFYGIFIGNHDDIYNLEYLVSIVDKNWPELLDSSINNNSSFSEDFFKQNALDKRLQMNIFKPGRLDGHMHSNLINYNINGKILKIPTPVFFAYENEIKYIDKIENTIISRIKNKFQGYENVDYFLEVDEFNQCYKIFKENNSPIIKNPITEFPFPVRKIICSDYVNRELRYS